MSRSLPLPPPQLLLKPLPNRPLSLLNSPLQLPLLLTAMLLLPPHPRLLLLKQLLLPLPLRLLLLLPLRLLLPLPDTVVVSSSTAELSATLTETSRSLPPLLLPLLLLRLSPRLPLNPPSRRPLPLRLLLLLTVELPLLLRPRLPLLPLDTVPRETATEMSR